MPQLQVPRQVWHSEAGLCAWGCCNIWQLVDTQQVSALMSNVSTLGVISCHRETLCYRLSPASAMCASAGRAVSCCISTLCLLECVLPQNVF